MQSNFVEASVNWEQSLKIFESLNHEAGIANMISNLGAAHSYMGDDATAIDYILRSLKISEKKGDSIRMATCLQNIGSIYSNKSETLDEALPYYKRALALSESIDYLDGIGISSLNLGDYYLRKEAYDSALYYFERSLDVSENAINIASILNNIGKVYAEQGDFKSAIKYEKEALEMAEKIDGKLEMAQIYLALADTYQKQGNLKLSIDNFEQASKIAAEIDSNYEKKDAFEGLANVYAELSDFGNAYKFQTLLSETEKTIYNIETDDKIKGLQFSYQLDKKEDEIEILEKNSEIEQLKTKRQRVISMAAGSVGVLLLVLALMQYRRMLFTRRTKEIIEKEKDRSDELLLNILPSETAEELKTRGETKAQRYELVTILFTDFKGFTAIAAEMSPEVLVNEIHFRYKKFDEIITKHGIEKIKTIGDAYMAAGGLPIPNETNPTDVIKAAIEIRDFMHELKIQRQKNKQPFFEIRIGIHSGPVVAGVVGTKKFAYDIWGDTVNIASRMESNSEAGKINISETTYQLVKDEFICDYRGEIEAKNRGKLKMYFVGEKRSVQTDLAQEVSI